MFTRRWTLRAALAAATGMIVPATAYAQDATTIRVAHNLPEKTATGVYFKTLAEEIEKDTTGTSKPLKVQLFANGQLFNDTQMPDAISSGTVEIGGINIDFVSQPPAQPLRIGSLPFMFDSWDSLWATEDNAAYRDIFTAQFNQMGMHHLGWVPYGTVEFFAKTPVKVPADLQGKRIRSFGVDTSRLVQAIGAAPVTMSSQELYQALQRGTIDGFLSGPTSVYSRKLYEVVKYGTSAQIMFLAFLAEANKQWWDGLPDDVRAAIGKASKTATDVARGYVKKEVAEAEKNLTEAGMELHKPTAEERQKWVEATSDVMNEYKKDGGNVAEKLLAIARGDKKAN